MEIGGGHLTDYCQKQTGVTKDIACKIKEKHCYVALEKAEIDSSDQNKFLQCQYTLPDGDKIWVSNAVRTGTPELLFDPAISNLE